MPKMDFGCTELMPVFTVDVGAREAYVVLCTSENYAKTVLHAFSSADNLAAGFVPSPSPLVLANPQVASSSIASL